jgi:hypothetical protein
MEFNEIIKVLNDFARENTFFSILIIAVLGNFLTAWLKGVLYFSAIFSKKYFKKAGSGISNWSTKNLENLLKKYREDLSKVERLKNNDHVLYSELVKDLYYCLNQLFLILILLIMGSKFGSHLFFYGLLGASSLFIYSIIAIIYYNNSLFENAKNFDKYTEKKRKKISRLESILKVKSAISE